MGQIRWQEFSPLLAASPGLAATETRETWSGWKRRGRAQALPSFQLCSATGLGRCAIVWRTQPASSTAQERAALRPPEQRLLPPILMTRIRRLAPSSLKQRRSWESLSFPSPCHWGVPRIAASLAAHCMSFSTRLGPPGVGGLWRQAEAATGHQAWSPSPSPPTQVLVKFSSQCVLWVTLVSTF